MNIVTAQIRKLVERGYTPQEARDICYKQQLKNLHIEKGTFKLTEQGVEYSNLTPEERDLIRKAKYNGSDKV